MMQGTMERWKEANVLLCQGYRLHVGLRPVFSSSVTVLDPPLWQM